MTVQQDCEAIAKAVSNRFAEIDARPGPGGALSMPAYYLEVATHPYHVTARKTDYELRGVLLVSSSLSEEAVRQVRHYMEPDQMKAAIEADPSLGGLVDQVHVRDWVEMSQEEYQAIGYWGAAQSIQIIGRTG